MNDIINDIARFLREHGRTICFAWTAALLVIYGGALARFAKNIAKAWHFVFRVLFFVLVCGFGYGLLTVFLARFLHSQLSHLDNIWYIVSVVAAFILLGILAEKKKQV